MHETNSRLAGFNQMHVDNGQDTRKSRGASGRAADDCDGALGDVFDVGSDCCYIWVATTI